MTKYHYKIDKNSDKYLQYISYSGESLEDARKRVEKKRLQRKIKRV